MNEQDRECTYTPNIESRSRNHCCHGKAISITYSECVSVALAIQHKKPMRCIILLYYFILYYTYYSVIVKDKGKQQAGCWEI